MNLAAVLITPNLQIPAKTVSLFKALEPGDFSDGTSVKSLSESTDLQRIAAAAPLINSFRRPLYDLYPELARLSERVATLGGRAPSLSGAGPTMYLLELSLADAHLTRNFLRTDNMVNSCRILCVRAVNSHLPICKNHV
jgi:4-diphosphocytidyl-2C-methyl-D-erythritol kinase